MMNIGRSQRKTAGAKKRALAMVMLIAFMLVMFAGCGKPETAESNTVIESQEESTVSSDGLNEMLEAMYAGETGSEAVVPELDAYLDAAPKRYDIKVTNVDTSNFPQVSVYYSVYDNTGARIHAGDRNNYVVVEENSNGKTEIQMVSTVKPVKTSQAVNLSIVMDLSTSMKVMSNIAYLKEAVTEFVSLVNPSDSSRVSLIGFTTQIDHFVPFTSSEDAITSEVKQMVADGRTAFYDSLYWAMIEASKQDGQKYVIAFTDGMDNSSQFEDEDIIEISKELGIPIYILGLGSTIDTRALKEIASESGGEFVSLSSMDAALDIYTEIFEKQSEQMVLTYTTTNTTEQDFWRTLDVYYIGQDDAATTLAQYNPVKTTVDSYADTTLEDLGGADLALDVVDQNDFVATWEGYYFNNSGKMDLTLDITDISASGEVSAVFSFTPSDKPGDADRTGSFAMVGYIDEATNTVYLDGTEWLTKAPDGYKTLDIYGQIFDNTFNGYFYRDYKPEFYLAKK
ncbi:MAG: vWA domain-containing protein [Eubacteriales bacterium]